MVILVTLTFREYRLMEEKCHIKGGLIGLNNLTVFIIIYIEMLNDAHSYLNFSRNGHGPHCAVGPVPRIPQPAPHSLWTTCFRSANDAYQSLLTAVVKSRKHEKFVPGTDKIVNFLTLSKFVC